MTDVSDSDQARDVDEPHDRLSQPQVMHGVRSLGCVGGRGRLGDRVVVLAAAAVGGVRSGPRVRTWFCVHRRVVRRRHHATVRDRQRLRRHCRLPGGCLCGLRSVIDQHDVVHGDSRLFHRHFLQHGPRGMCAPVAGLVSSRRPMRRRRSALQQSRTR